MGRRDTGIGWPSGTAVPSGERDRSALLAHRAMALIKGLKLPATPRIYEFCYAYATGDYPSLNMAINDLLNRRIAIGDATIRQIGAKYIPENHNGEGIDHVGLRVKQVIGEVLGALGTIINAEGALQTAWENFQLARLSLYRDIGTLPYDEWEAFSELFPAEYRGPSLGAGTSDTRPAGAPAAEAAAAVAR